MQLGSRWPLGSSAPAKLPQVVQDAIAEVEAELHSLRIDTTGWYWTLTYLENRPVVQLDDGTTIKLDESGCASISQDDY